MKILIVDHHPEQSGALQAVLQQAGFEVLGVIADGAEDIYRHSRELEPDAILIAADSPARDTLEHIALIARNAPRPMILLAAQAEESLMRDAAHAGLAFYVVPQLSSQAVSSLVVAAVAHFRGTRQLQRDLELARQRMEERRIIDLAKCRLMEREGLAEARAYRHLQRMAMDRNLKMVEVARTVLAI